METDRIEKKVILKAPRDRAWRAISDSAEFGAWFGAEFDGRFIAGSEMTGRIAATKVDPEVAKLQAPHVGKPIQFVFESIEPLKRFSFRWHPLAIDPNRDYSHEPMTLVSFELADADEGTLLTITESGFSQLPIERRSAAFSANNGGWTHQARLVKEYLAVNQ